MSQVAEFLVEKLGRAPLLSQLSDWFDLVYERELLKEIEKPAANILKSLDSLYEWMNNNLETLTPIVEKTVWTDENGNKVTEIKEENANHKLTIVIEESSEQAEEKKPEEGSKEEEKKPAEEKNE